MLRKKINYLIAYVDVTKYCFHLPVLVALAVNANALQLREWRTPLILRA